MIEAALELRLVVPYEALPGGAHLSKRHLSCGSCILAARPRSPSSPRIRVAAARVHDRVVREFVALFVLGLFVVGLVDVLGGCR